MGGEVLVESHYGRGGILESILGALLTAGYAAAVAGMPVPWWFVAVVHCMECSMRFDQHLHNGDPLSGRREPLGLLEQGLILLPIVPLAAQDVAVLARD